MALSHAPPKDYSSVYAETPASAFTLANLALCPELPKSSKIQVADVGHVDEQGMQFEPAPLPLFLNTPAEDNGNMRYGRRSSGGVEGTSVARAVQANTSLGSTDLYFEYMCKEQQSPVEGLVLPDTKSLRAYIRDGYPKWQQPISEDLDPAGGKLKTIYFIRGWLKTTIEWTAAAAASSGTRWKVSTHANTGVAATPGPVFSRCENLLLPIQRNQNFSQRTFVRCYAVKSRDLLRQRLEASARPARAPDLPGRGSDQIMSISDIDANWPGHEGVTLSVEALLDYILENSHAELALASDEDLVNLVKGEGEDLPRDIAQFLQRTKPAIVMDDQKCGTISHYESICRRRKSACLDRNREDANEGFILTDHTLQAGRTVDSRLLLGPDATPHDWPHMQFTHKNAENGAVTSAAISPNGKWLAASFDDVFVTIWRLCDGRVLQNLDDDGHNDTIWTIAWDPDGTSLASGSADHDVIVWDVASGQIVHKLEGHESDVTALAYTPDGIILASGAADAEVRLWDVETGDLKAKLAGHTIGITHVLFSQDSTRLAACTDLGVTLWDPRTSQRAVELHGHTSAVWAAALAAQSDRLVTGSEDMSARVWSADDGTELVTLQEHTGAVWAVAFSPDGSQVATGSYDGQVIVCDSWTGKCLHAFGKQLTKPAEAVAYSTNGRLIAAGSADGHVRVWDARSGEAIAEFEGHEEKVKKVMFTPDDGELVSVAEDGTIRAWGISDVLSLL